MGEQRAVSPAESSAGLVEGRGRCGGPSSSYWQKLLLVLLGVPGLMVTPACGTAHGMPSPGESRRPGTGVTPYHGQDSGTPGV